MNNFNANVTDCQINLGTNYDSSANEIRKVITASSNHKAAILVELKKPLVVAELQLPKHLFSGQALGSGGIYDIADSSPSTKGGRWSLFE